MKLISWNVNGIRAAYKKGLVEFIERQSPDIFCVQETKAHKEQCEPGIRNLGGLTSYWSSAVRKGYSGVATFVKEQIAEPSYGIGVSDYDSEGRFVISKHPGFTLYNIYFPNGGSGPERHLFKQRFLKDLLARLRESMKRGESIIITGDYNIAHHDFDVYDPKKLAGESGFLPEERAWLDEFFAAGMVDTFRHFHPHVREKYTWWSQIERARIGNRGWRIDYFSVSKDLLPRLLRAEILDGQEGSDHCPVLLELKD